MNWQQFQNFKWNHLSIIRKTFFPISAGFSVDSFSVFHFPKCRRCGAWVLWKILDWKYLNFIPIYLKFVIRFEFFLAFVLSETFSIFRELLNVRPSRWTTIVDTNRTRKKTRKRTKIGWKTISFSTNGFQQLNTQRIFHSLTFFRSLGVLDISIVIYFGKFRAHFCFVCIPLKKKKQMLFIFSCWFTHCEWLNHTPDATNEMIRKCFRKRRKRIEKMHQGKWMQSYLD